MSIQHALPLLMPHQQKWIADKAPMKIAEKARRTGITFAEALDAALIAAADKHAGGTNVFYMGDTRDKGREFIGAVRSFATSLIRAGVLPEGALLGQGAKASALRVHFASGFRVEALSSRPENIRGLQGVVVIDEAAFHTDVHHLLDAVTALLIWGGRVRVISTHNGMDSPFNALVDAARTGRVPMSLHRITFADAVQGGLYRRLCASENRAYKKEDEDIWVQNIIAAYGTRHDAKMEELDVIPRQSTGRYFADALLLKAAKGAPTVLRFQPHDGFAALDVAAQTARTEKFISAELRPAMAALNSAHAHYVGEDFGRVNDRTVLMLGAKVDGALSARLTIELGNMPYDMQRRILFALLEAVPQLAGLAMDATGNGAWLAEVTKARFGRLVDGISLSASFYDRAWPAYRSALESGAMHLPDDEDILADHRAVRMGPDGPRLARGARTLGRDGRPRHGDAAVAALMLHHAAFGAGQGVRPSSYGHMSAGKRRFSSSSF